jgi:drug/metabolite transporter (DMT)-like permease
MDDIAVLKRTLRRCTAALVVAIGVATAALAGTVSKVPGLLLVVAGGVYLAGSLVYVPRWSADDEWE